MKHMVVQVRREAVEAWAELRLPVVAHERLRGLLNRSSEGHLSERGREELRTLKEWDEDLSAVRADALAALGRRSE